jgi:hypothetical protein
MFHVMTLSGTVAVMGAAHSLDEIGRRSTARMNKRVPHTPVKTLVTIFSYCFIAGLTRNGLTN